MPWVTVLRRPSGAPAAITSSPTCTLSESPNRATVRLSTLSTLSTARSVFGCTDLHQQLQQRGVTQVVVTGIATSLGVESTARAAHEHGYHVVLAVDAVADTDPDNHRHSIDNIFPRLGETATTAEILTKVQARHHI